MKVSTNLFIISAIIMGSSAVENLSQCNERAKNPIPDIDKSVKIGSCNRPPCRLKKGKTVGIEIAFKPEHDVDSLQTSVSAYIAGVPFPFIGVDGTNACNNIYKSDGTTKANCPLKAGEDYVYKNGIDVLDIYPRLKLVVHWALKGSNDLVHCFEVPARITN